MSIPVVRFTDERLPNGLRLIIAEDHLAPVVAVNVWYDVGSKHEVAGKTGFAHLFEHVMFQGCRNVGKAEHIALVQAAGGTMNGTTWLDRTNYFETMPAHQLELALWLEADRMGTLLDALSQENLDNQREVVKNEKRWSYDNRPYGSWYGEAPGPPLPAGASVPPPDDRLDGGPRRGLARGRQRRSSGPTTRRTTRSCRSSATSIRRGRARWVERYFGGIPANPAIPPLGDLSLPPTLGGERPRDRRRPGPAAARSTSGSARRPSATRGSTPSTSPAQILAGGKGSRLHRRLVRDERIAQDVALFTLGFVGGASICAGWATVRPGVTVERVEAAFLEELERLGREPISDDELARARALIETDELGALQRVEERADRLSMYATLFDDPGLINRMLGALPGGHARSGSARRRGRRLPGGQPGGPDLPARDAAGRRGARRRPTAAAPRREDAA